MAVIGIRQDALIDKFHDEYTYHMLKGLCLRHNELHLIQEEEEELLIDPSLRDFLFLHSNSPEQFHLVIDTDVNKAEFFEKQHIPVIILSKNKSLRHPHKVNNWWKIFQEVVKIDTKRTKEGWFI